MYTKDYLLFTTFHSEPHLNPAPIREPIKTANETVFPAELLDSGFAWTEFLTAEG
jgi:hypothetical protein